VQLLEWASPMQQITTLLASLGKWQPAWELKEINQKSVVKQSGKGICFF
jgi:hypothetical protein